MINLKAVIPVAGLGMHMLPATKAIPKEMLPIVDKPMIQYIVDEIVAAGIKKSFWLRTRPRMRLKTTSTPLTNLKRCWSSVLNVNCWRKCSLFVLLA
ncbi:sugar phosphate nucleotidyltransferase [Escherichia coli]